ALEETHDVDFANALLETGRDARARAKRARRDRVLHESIVPPSSADRSRERLEDLRSHDSRDRAPLDSRAEEHLSRKEEPASSKEVSRVDPSPMVGGAELAPRSVEDDAAASIPSRGVERGEEILPKADRTLGRFEDFGEDLVGA